MNKKVTILFALTVFISTAFAQDIRKTKGYQGIVELGGATFVGTREARFLGAADFINGYKFNPNYSMGIGIGVRFATNAIGEKGSYVVPLYGNFRANLFFDTSDKVFPYTQTKLGIAFVPSSSRVAVFHQSFGIGFKDSPTSIGLCGELFSVDEVSVLFIGLNIGFSF